MEIFYDINSIWKRIRNFLFLETNKKDQQRNNKEFYIFFIIYLFTYFQMITTNMFLQSTEFCILPLVLIRKHFCSP